MEKIVIQGGERLYGKVKVEGAKNAVLPVLAASLMASEGESKIFDVPALDDVLIINEVLRNLNVDVHFENNCATIDATNQLATEAPRSEERRVGKDGRTA